MPDEQCPIFVTDCHVRTAVELINHAWDPVVLSALRLGPRRRNELLTHIAGASDKVLTQSLRRLQARGLVVRSRPTGPTAGTMGAIYQLTSLGESFAHGPLAELARWAADNQSELVDSWDDSGTGDSRQHAGNPQLEKTSLAASSSTSRGLRGVISSPAITSAAGSPSRRPASTAAATS